MPVQQTGVAFCIPTIANVWPRRSCPLVPGKNREPRAPDYTGEHLDGFGYQMTIHAVANPVESGIEPRALNDRMPGYGIVRFDHRTREVRAECWPRWVDPSDPDARQYEGWPRAFHQEECYGRKAVAWLPEVEVEGMHDPVVTVVDEEGGEISYALRIRGTRYRPKVFREGRYTLRVGDPDQGSTATLSGLKATPENRAKITVRP